MLEWLKKRYTQPVVVVQDSAAVDTSCKANGLDLVHLLRPFAVHRGPLYAHLGDRGEAVVSTNFAVRLVRPDCVREVDRRARLHFLRQRMRENAPADLAYGEQLDAILDELLDPTQGTPRPRPMWLSSPSTTATLLQRATSPWHAAFIRDYHFLVRCSPFDTLDYPVGILYALSTHEIMRPGYSHDHTTSSSSDHAAAPAAAESTASVSITVGAERLLQLFQQQSQLPLRAWEDMPGMDTELHRYYLLVHDARLGTTLAEARQLLTVAQRQYGPNNCALLKINSVRDPQDIHSLDPSPWVDANELLCLDVPAMNALVNSGAGPPLCSAAGTPLSAPLTAREGQPSTASNNATSTSNNFSNVVNNASVASTTGSVSNNTESAAHAGHHLSVVVAREAVAVQNTFGKWPNGEPKVTGCFLSPEDLSEVRNVMQYYLGQSLFKYLERRLRMLDLVVEERRTTALGKVASWFRAKEESKPNNHHALVLCRDGTTSVYAASSLEMYMRRCGDLSLALQAYDAAINYYKMCIDELLETLPSRPLNRAFLGGCQEGLAMAHFFLGKLALPSPTPWATGPTRGDVKSRSYVNRLEIAHGDYLLADERPYALRLSFVMYELCRTCHPPAMDRARAALDHLLATGETAHERICAAVAEDLLAGVFLVRNPPRPTGTLMPAQLTESYPIYCYMRSYARHLTAAGLLYKDHNMPAMALRAFLRVLKVLRGAGQRGDWLTLYESTLRVLAELYVLLGKDVQGLVRASVAVAQGSPSYRNTRTGMQNFVAFWQEQRRVLQKIGYALCPHMPVPVLLRRSFAVERRFYHTDATTEREARRIGRELVELEWRGIEDALRRHCQRVWLPTHPAYTFPHFHSDAKPYYLFPPTASPSSAAQHTATKAGNSNNNNNTNSTSSNATITTTTTPASLIVPNTSKVVGRVVGSARRGGHNDTEDADARTSRAQPSHAEGGGAATATRPVNKTWAATRRSFTIAFGEALQLSVVLRNPVGGPLAVEGLCLLYLSRAQPGQLWRSRSALSIDLAANAEEKVTLDFEPLEKGEYVIVGLCWTLMEQEGYYYFNTRERRAGCAESVYEYAFDQPTPVLEAEENIFVSVTAARARLATRFDPPLPSKLFHGEYFHTQLHITNVSTQCEAGHVLVQRSAANAQFLWIDGYDLQAHMQTAEPMLLAERIRPQETRRFDLTIRAQHDDGGDAAEHCWNHIFLLFSYTPDTAGLERSTSLARRTLSLVDTTSAAAPAAANNTTTTTTTNNNNNNNSSTTPLTSTAPLTSTNAMTASHASPVQVALSSSDEGGNVLPGLTSSQAEAASTATTSAAAAAAAHRREKSDLVATVSSHETRAMRGGTALRLHRLLRRYEVRPMMRIHSRVLPPSQSELALVALVTAKHIADIRETPPPMRVTRVMTLQEPGWQVRCGHVASLVQDRAVGCIAFPGGAVTLPLLIHRRPSAADEGGTTKTTANANSSNGEGMSSGEHTLYEETTCLPLAEALPSHNKAAAVIANVGSALATSEMSRYFLRTCVRGPGEVGHVEDGATGLTFYLDRASQQQQKELQLQQQQQQQRRQQRSECTSHTLSVQQQAERSVFGDVLAQYPPLAVAVVWVLDDGQHVRSGQLFHFVDPLDYHASPSALHATRTPGMALAPNNTLSSAAGNHSGSVADDEPSADSLKQQQHKLCTALMERRTAQPGRLHSVAFHVAVPPRVQNTPACSSVARVPVTFTCLSLAPFPLLVEVAAGVWHENKNSSTAAAPSLSFSPSVGNASQVADSIGLGVLFVGQTQQSFVLLPSTTHTAHFVAHILLPGLVDCNAFDVRVVPLCFWPGKGTFTAATTATTSNHEEAELAETTHSLGRPQRDGTRRPERGVLYTGMTRGAYLRMLREAASTSSSSNNNSAMATCEGVQQGCPSVVAHHTSHNNNNEEEYAAASPTVVEAQGSAGRAMLSDAELLSRQAPRGVLPSQLLVIGHEQPALTQACFIYASSSTAAEGFVDHTESSAVRRRAAAREAEDIRIFQEHYRTFEAAQANAAGPDAQLYVYRPAVKPYVELEPGHTPVAGAQGPAHTAAAAAMVGKPLTPRPPPIPVHTSLAAETPAREGRVVSELHSETTERSWLQPASVAERDAAEQPRPTLHIPTTTSSNSSDEDEDDDGLLVQAAMAEQDSPASPLRHLPPQTLAGTAWQEAELSESSVTNSTEAAAAANHEEEEEESTTSSETDETTERADTAVAAGTS